MEHIKITVSGKVQGVWFRKYTEGKARDLGIKGFVRNQPDGSVYIEAEAPRPVLDQFISWCHVGSPLSMVKEVKWEKGELANYNKFEVR